MLFLEHGKPMIFGKDRDKGIRLHGLKPEVVELGNGITEADLLVHDETLDDPTIAFMLSRAWATRTTRCRSASSAPSAADATTT